MSTRLPALTGWIPNTDVLTTTGTALLNMAVDTLTAFGYAADYDRMLLSHGLVLPVEPGVNQILVGCSRLFLGRPGQEEFTVAAGASGKFAFQTAVFAIEIWRQWPIRQRQQAISVGAIAAVREKLWRDAVIVYSGALGLALGGVISDPVISAANIHVGTMLPKGPGGGLAGWSVEVDVVL